MYNRDTNLLKFFGNVVLERSGARVVGDYMLVDLNEENVLMNEPVGHFATFKITAREGHAYANKIEAINGDEPPTILGVTLLSSFGQRTLTQELGVDLNIEKYVTQLAKMAKDACLS
ncbi:hypothetical protein tpqmel_1076, partial [Candidatus Gastranaerophilus sp. (ex Termes propinquus)]